MLPGLLCQSASGLPDRGTFRGTNVAQLQVNQSVLTRLDTSTC